MIDGAVDDRVTLVGNAAEPPHSPDCLPDDKSVGEIYDGERSLCSAHRTGLAVPQDISAPPHYRITSRHVRAAT